MSSKRKSGRTNWGGARAGSGRPRGITKAKISVNVAAENWHKAMKKWGGKGSHLVEKLLVEYLELPRTPLTYTPGALT